MQLSLNQVDVELLKSIFATKADFTYFEIKAKKDLKRFTEERIDKLRDLFTDYFKSVGLESDLNKLEIRITKLESQTLSS